MITFATFHIDCTPEAATHIADNNIYLDNRNEYLTQIVLMFESAALTHPNCKKVVLSDRHTDLSSLPSDIHIHRLDLDPKTVMLSRLQAQINYVTHHDQERDIVFLDSDMLIQGDLSPLFVQDFDVGLTYRQPGDVGYDKMPFNGGVIFVAHYRKTQVLQFLNKVYTLYQAKSENQGIWWGDQYALLEAVEPANFFERTAEIVEVNGCKILFLPCTIYNYSSANRMSAILRKLKDKQIIHFKGARKRLIQPYWQAHLAWQTTPAPWRLVQRIRPYPKLVVMALAELVSDVVVSFVPTCQAFWTRVLQKGRRLIFDRVS